MIYEILCWTTGLRYIGATTKTLKERLYDHKRKRSCTSKFVIEHNNYEMYLLEKCDIINLKIREDYYIRHTDCVNVKGEIPDRKTSLQKYNNSKKGKETSKKYRITEKSQITKNKYKETEIYKNYRKRKWYCDKCNIEILEINKSAHCKSKRHMEF